MFRKFVLSLAFSVFGLALFADPATGWLQTGAGPYDYNDPANWVNGEINGVFGKDLTLTADQTITFAADTVLTGGLTFACGGGKKISLTSSDSTVRTVTLGGDIVNNSAGNVEPSETLTFDLGGEKRTINCAAGTVLIHGVIQNGGLVYTGAKDLRLYGANTFSGGFTVAATGYLYVNGPKIFGSGTVTFEDGTKLNSSSTTTISEANPYIIKGSIYYTSGDKKNLNLGTGPITITTPITITVNNYTLTFGGPVDANSPYKITDIRKEGGGSLSTAAGVEISGESDSIVSAGGTWYFNGPVSGVGPLVTRGNVEMKGTCTFTGDVHIESGSLRFCAKNVLPANARILVKKGATFRNYSSNGYGIGSLLASGRIDPASEGTLGIAENENNDFDLTNYPNIIIAPNGADRSYSGTITPPSTGVLKLGGAGKTLTLSGVLPSGCDIDASTGSLKITASQPNFNGTVTMGNGFSFVLGEGVSAPGMTVVAGTYAVGDKNAIKGGVVRLGTATEGEVDSLKKVVLNTAHLSIDAPSSGAVTLKIGEVSVGVARQGVSKMTVPANVTLRIGDLARANGWEMLQVENSGKVFFETVPTLIGEGPVGTVKTPVMPFVRIGTALATYDETNGLRALAEGEYEEYEGGYEGPATSGANVVLVGSGTVTFTGSAAVNSLTVGNLVLAGAEETRLTITSGAVATISEGASDLVMPIDFGTQRGYISAVPNTVVKLTGAISGTGGITLSDLQFGTTSSGMSLGGVGSTYSGDVVVTGYFTISDPSGFFFPNGSDEKSRDGDVYLYGKFNMNSTTVHMNGLYGSGTVACAGGGTSYFYVGENGADGNYTGEFVNNPGGANFYLYKKGLGFQRFSKAIGWKYSLQLSEGELQIDGSLSVNRGGSVITVSSGGTLSGAGSIHANSSIKLNAGGILKVGSELAGGQEQAMTLKEKMVCENGARMAFYEDRDRSTRLVSDYAITGADATVSVSVSGTKGGKWKIIEAETLEPTFELEEGVRGKLYRVGKEISESGKDELWYERTTGLSVIIR